MHAPVAGYGAHPFTPPASDTEWNTILPLSSPHINASWDGTQPPLLSVFQSRGLDSI